MATILVIEDEPSLLGLLDENLKQAGYHVLVARSGAAALSLLADVSVDLIVLDPMLPDISGFDVCRALTSVERARDVLILIVSAKGDEADRIAGFELGASDYMVKPISVRELVLRVRALLRRGAPRLADSQAIESGALRVDTGAHRVWVNDIEVELTRLEFKLLVALVEPRPRVQTRSALIKDVWGGNPDVAGSTINTHVTRLREKLGVVGACIETVHGSGYRFSERPLRFT